MSSRPPTRRSVPQGHCSISASTTTPSRARTTRRSLRAALLSRGAEPKTHSGAIHLFNTELVRAGLFAASHNRLLGSLQRARELADYDAAVTFPAADAAAELAEAESFGRTVLEFLAREGWT